jgi:hypothetical protein
VRIWDVRADRGMRCDKRSDTGPCTVTRGQILGPCKLVGEKVRTLGENMGRPS